MMKKTMMMIPVCVCYMPFDGNECYFYNEEKNLNLADQVYGILLVIHDKCRPLAIS